jgi:hypothetical protein
VDELEEGPLRIPEVEQGRVLDFLEWRVQLGLRLDPMAFQAAQLGFEPLPPVQDFAD